MSTIRLKPLPPSGTRIYRITWNSPVCRYRTWADYRSLVVAEIIYSKIRQHLPDSRPTLGYVKVP